MIADAPPASAWSRLIARLRRWGAGPCGADAAGAIGARSVFSRQARLALLLGVALLVMLRLPHAWEHGRLQDEEGTIFLAYAWHRPAVDALFRSFGGYLNIGANATTLIVARLVRSGGVPLEAAPYLTMTMALSVQLLPAVLILTGRARWLANRWAVLVALLVVAASPTTEEIYFNVLHIQFHLALCTALILALAPPASRAGQLGYAAILFVAPLCGPGAIVLVPLFVLRMLVDRDRARTMQVAALGLGTAVQMLVFFAPSPVRGHVPDPVSLAALMAVRLIGLPLGTPFAAKALRKAVYAAYLVRGAGWWCAAGLAAAYFGALLALAVRGGRDGAVWLVLSGLAIAVVSFGGGMIDVDAREWFTATSGERYNFLPLVLLGLASVALAMRADGRHRRLFVMLCGLTLVSSAISYFKPIRDFRDGPAWTGEVAAWRRDHDHLLAGWPATWSADLSDRDLRCHPPQPGALATTDPSYCESAWLVRVAEAIRESHRRAAKP